MLDAIKANCAKMRIISLQLAKMSVGVSVSNCAGPLNDFPPGQGLKSGGKNFTNTIQFLTADVYKNPKGFENL